MATIPKSLQPPARAPTLATESKPVKQKEEVKQVTQPQPSNIKIGPKEFSQQAVQAALRHIQRKSAGKRSAELYNDEAKRAVDYIRQYGIGDISGAQIRRDMSRGAELKITAKEAGFDNVEEFSSVSGFQYSKASKTAEPTVYVSPTGGVMSVAPEIAEKEGFRPATGYERVKGVSDLLPSFLRAEQQKVQAELTTSPEEFVSATDIGIEKQRAREEAMKQPITPLTREEANKLKSTAYKDLSPEARYRLELSEASLTGVPRQLISPWGTPMNLPDATFFQYLQKYYSPKQQWKWFKEAFDYKYNVDEAINTAKLLESLNKAIEKKVDKEGNWIGTQEEYKSYSESYDKLASNPAYQKIVNTPELQTTWERLSKSKLSKSQKRVVAIAITGAEFGSITFVPGARIITGVDMLFGGMREFNKAKSLGGKVQAGAEIGFGGLLTASGFGGEIGILPRATSRVGKAVSGVARVANIPTFGGLYGYSVYKETKDIDIAITAGLTASVIMASPEIYSYFSKDFGKFIADKRGKAGRQRTKQVQVQKGKQKTKTKEKTSEKKVSIDDAVDFLTIKKDGKAKSFNDKLDDVRSIMNKIQKETNPFKRKTLIEDATKVFKAAYGKEETVRLLKEWYAQEGFGILDVATKSKVKDIRNRVESSSVSRIRDSGISIEKPSYQDLITGRTKSGIGSISADRQSGNLLFGSSFRGKEKEKFAVPTKVKEKEKQLESTVFNVAIVQSPREADKMATGLITPTITQAPQVTEKVTPTMLSDFGLPGRPRQPGEKPKPPKKPVALWFDFAGEGYRKKSQVGYETFVKQGRKFVKVSGSKPHTKRSALSLGSRIVDKTLSAQFKIQPVTQTKIIRGKKGKVKTAKVFKANDLVREEGYFSLNQNKFREYKIRNKQKITTPQKFIERKEYRLDSPGETGRIQRARNVSIFSFNFNGKKNKRKLL